MRGSIKPRHAIQPRHRQECLAYQPAEQLDDFGLGSLIDVLLQLRQRQFAEGKALAEDAGKVAEVPLASGKVAGLSDGRG
jgi:hypothetical protein